MQRQPCLPALPTSRRAAFDVAMTPRSTIRFRRWLAFAMLVLVASFAAHAETPPLRVVFVGNSYTYTNDLPTLFAALIHAEQPERVVETEAFVAPGGYVNERWRDGIVQQYLRDHPVDVLVLQEAGGWLRCADHPTLRTSFACTDSLRTHKRFAEFAATLGVRTVLFGTWGPDAHDQSAISRVTRRLGRAIGAQVADVGEAVVALRRHEPETVTFTDTMLHPTADVSMLAAIVLFTRIEGRMPEARDIALASPLIAVRALPDGRVPLSAQRDALPVKAVESFSAERLSALIAVADTAHGSRHHH